MSDVRQPDEHASKAASQVPVDLPPPKNAAEKLPDGDPARRLIKAELDFLPRSVLEAKADSWVLLLFPQVG